MRPIEIVCHRGANQVAPENTYASAQQCIDWGMDYLEIDVNTSRDGVMYVFHGPGLERTTNGAGKIYEMDSYDVDQLDCGSWFGSDHAGARVPRLAPFLEWIDHRIKLFFDVKWADLDALATLVQDLGISETCFFWFGRERLAHQLRSLPVRLPLKINVRSAADVDRAVNDYNADLVELRIHAMNDAMKKRCHEHGLRTMVMHTEDDVDAFNRIIDWKPDLVNVDHADRFLDALARRGQIT